MLGVNEGSQPKLTEGEVVDGRYRIGGELARGGMGVVYRASHVSTGRPLALKTLLFGHADASLLARFQQEARAVAAIGDPHLLEVVDFGVLPNGTPYMAMELLRGRDLDVVITEEGPLPLARAVAILGQACAVLEKVHAAGIVHRDIKSKNLMLVEHGDARDFVKLIDFGIAKVTQDAAASLTDTGAMLGSPAYMAPEQLGNAKAVDGRADVYALGVVLYHALTGELPFHADSLPALIGEVVTLPPPSPRELAPELPPVVDKVVAKALAKDPDDRYQSVGELSAALRALETAEGDAAAAAPALSRRAWRLGVGLVALVLLGAAAWGLWPRADDAASTSAAHGPVRAPRQAAALMRPEPASEPPAASVEPEPQTAERAAATKLEPAARVAAPRLASKPRPEPQVEAVAPPAFPTPSESPATAEPAPAPPLEPAPSPAVVPSPAPAPAPDPAATPNDAVGPPRFRHFDLEPTR